MSQYEELIASYAEQKARGLKPRGRCDECGRELALRADNTVGWHKRSDRQGRPDNADCPGSAERSMNLTLDRVQPDLDTVEARLVVKAISHALQDAFTLNLDADKKAVLRRALDKLNSPDSRKTLTRTEEVHLFAALDAKEN